MNIMKLRLVLTPQVVDRLPYYGHFMSDSNFEGFEGYVEDLRPKFPALIAIKLNGLFYIEPIESNKKLSKRKLLKIIKYLIKIKFLEAVMESPFEEFEYYSNIKKPSQVLNN